jgi:hypothetical protein
MAEALVWLNLSISISDNNLNGKKDLKLIADS